MLTHDSEYEILFEPVRIGPQTMEHRFYQAPHCSGPEFGLAHFQGNGPGGNCPRSTVRPPRAGRSGRALACWPPTPGAGGCWRKGGTTPAGELPGRWRQAGRNLGRGRPA